MTSPGCPGTGPDGAVTLADVEAAQRASAVPALARARAAAGFDPAEMRKAIAAAMARSKREIPHYYLTQTVDLRRALAWLEDANRERPPTERLLPAVLFLKATALALRKVPELNGFWDEGRLPRRRRHPRRLGDRAARRWPDRARPSTTPTSKSLAELMAAMRDLVQRARAGGLRSSELSDPTITVTSLGERGAETVIGVIYPPQVAIVGFGRIVERPWAVDGASRRSARGQRSASPPTTVRATATAAACCSPRSTACCRSPKPYDRSRTAQDGPGHAGRHRPRGGPRRVAAGQGPAARSWTSTRWTS